MKTYSIRPASFDEIPALERLIELSARELSRADYTPEQIESAVRHIFGVDSELVGDGTYFVVTSTEGDIVACGGWSKRKTLFGGDQYAARESGILDPASEPAKIRAFFVHPDHARKGIGKALLEHCEAEAQRYGYGAVELMATLPGVKLYAVSGYESIKPEAYVQPDGVSVPGIHMRKKLKG